MAGGSDSDIIKIGPFGSTSGGDTWDGKGHGDIVQIFVSHDTSISSIQYQYVQNGKLVLSQLYGYPRANKFDVVSLNYPKEYITGVRGYMKVFGEGILSITFTTNLGEYGPFGTLPNSQPKEFSVKFGENRQFFGFYGTIEPKFISLGSIGFYMKLKTELDLVKKERTN